ncbi:hypothetical protein H1R20_g12954, partial [Candolleomyces eurysporus]
MSAADYTTHFKLLAAQGNLKTSGIKGATDNMMLRDLYIAGLNTPLRREVKNEKDAPETLADWITRAIARDQQWRLNNTKSNALLPLSKKTNIKSTRTQNTVSFEGTRIAKLTDAEQEKLRREGRCFRCREQGHLSRDCPRPNRTFPLSPSAGPSTYRPSQNSTYRPPQNSSFQPPPYQKKEEPKKWEPKKFDTYIHHMLNNMNEEDFNTFHEAWTSSPFERSTNDSEMKDFPTGD